jgi:hypothetical protein
MNEIHRVLSRAARRLLVLDVFRLLALTLTIAIAGLMLLLIVQRVFAIDFSFPRHWSRAFAAAALGALLAAIAWAILRRRHELAVARELDERAELRESLSTALTIESSEDAWARVVVETARQRAITVDLRRAIPIEAPRLWPVPPAMLLALAILWFSIPQMDVLGALRTRTKAKEQTQELVQAKLDAKATDDKLKELMSKAKIDFAAEETKTSDAQADKPLTAEEIRSAALKRLTSLQEKLDELKQGDKAKELESIRQHMRQLKQPGPGPMDNLSKSLQKGDFQQAKEDLEKLKQELAAGDMSDEKKEQAKQQMEKLAEQLSKLAESRQSIEQALKEAGISKEQAQKLAQEAMKNPESLKKAIDQLPSLNAQQKQGLMQMAKSQQQSNSQCKGMSESMQQMAQGMSKQGMSQSGQQGMEGMSQQLSELEQMSQDMQSVQAAADEAQKQASKMAGASGEGEGKRGNASGESNKGGNSSWQAGQSAGKTGSGSGNPGQSSGGLSPNERDAPFDTTQKMSQSKNTAGPIIGSRLVYGDQVRGESRAEYEAAVTSASQSASKALETMTVRKELQGAVKHYFGRLEARGQPTGTTTPAPPSPVPNSDKK